jgi:hypothetical protein
VRAWLNLRYTVPERREAFKQGLSRLGYKTHDGFPDNPKDGDLLLTWNRIGMGDTAARRFAHAGCPVIVAENASWGNDFLGERWYTLARNYHNTAGMFPIGDNAVMCSVADSGRWDSLGVELPSWRTSGETVLLAQRGIGAGIPQGWTERAAAEHGARIRRHPGTREAIPLETDLANAGKVVTWGSGAAIKALLMGIPVVSYMPAWIGEQDNTDAGRLAMFRRLAWAQWKLDEVREGAPFRWLLQ